MTQSEKFSLTTVYVLAKCILDIHWIMVICELLISTDTYYELFFITVTIINVYSIGNRC